MEIILLQSKMPFWDSGWTRGYRSTENRFYLLMIINDGKGLTI